MACDCILILAPQYQSDNPLIALPDSLLFVPKADRVVTNTGELASGPGKPVAVRMFTGPCPFCGANHQDGEVTSAPGRHADFPEYWSI